jgi:hypothetical protein
MTDIKRPNYFTSQFLVEKDFDDEQAYHLNSRRRHNRLLHTSGVVDGLGVTVVGGRTVQVSTGTAIDNNGREIVLNDPVVYTLGTGGGGSDVYLTIAYQELFDPADRFIPSGLDDFTRTTERPLLQDSTTVPAADGSVIVLARIHLNNAAAIESNGSIDPTVRTLASAKVALKAITTEQLADGAVTLGKLADEVKPLSVQRSDSITVATDTTLRQITIGETHSARTDNPHGTTAAQIDNQGGVNQLAAQINAGTGIITRSHVASAIVSGVVTFENLTVNEEMVSNIIDPGFGPGAVSVQLAIDDVPTTNPFPRTSAGDTNYARTVQLRSEVDRSTGGFRIFASRSSGSTASVAVRWYAFTPIAGAVGTVGVGVVVSPATVPLSGSATQVFTAQVNNTNSTGVTWSITEGQGQTAGGTLSVSGNSATYTPPVIDGKYHVVATSTADSAKTGTAEVNVVVGITVLLSRTTATVVAGTKLTQLGATVFNTANKAVSWSIQEGTTGGSLSATTGASVDYTAPTAPGKYHVVATSAVDSTKNASCEITVVLPVTITLNQTSVFMGPAESVTLTATVSNTADKGVTWSIQESGEGSLSASSGTSVVYTAPGTLETGPFHVIATSHADPTKTATCTITVFF